MGVFIEITRLYNIPFRKPVKLHKNIGLGLYWGINDNLIIWL